MKKIVMIGPSPLSHGGMASVISTLLKYNYSKNGKCVFIATQTDGPVLMKTFTAIWALMNFTRLLIAGKVEILHAHVASGVSFWRKAAFISLANLAGCPVVFHLHGGKFRSFIDNQPPWLRKFSLSIIKNSAHCFTLTRETSNWLKDTLGVENIEVFPNPTPIGAHKSCKRSMDILFLGRIEKAKGIFDLLHAFSIIHERLPEARLIIGGEGDFESINSLSQELNISHAVVLLGWIDEKTRTEWLCRSGVFVLPSLFEQMPMTILEAMATETPIVATRVGAVNDMLEDGLCGFLVDPGDSLSLANQISSILSNPEKTKPFTDRAYSRVKNVYSADHVVQNLHNFYASLIKKN